MQCCAGLHLCRLAAQYMLRYVNCMSAVLHTRPRCWRFLAGMLNTFQPVVCAWARQTTHQTAHGQLLDIATAPIGTVDLSRYTLPTYMRIVTFKTAFYSFYLPVACGLLVGGVTAPPAFALAKDIGIQMGQYFQARCVHQQTRSFYSKNYIQDLHIVGSTCVLRIAHHSIVAVTASRRASLIV